jgi:prevent-host-death family protein
MEVMVKIVGAFEAKTQLSRLLKEVEINHEEIVIQRHGSDIACIIPYERYAEKNGSLSGIVEAFSGIRKTQKKFGSPIKALVNEGRKR